MLSRVHGNKQRPQLLEACFDPVSRLRKRGNHRAVHAFACAGIKRVEPDDILFTHPWVYESQVQILSSQLVEQQVGSRIGVCRYGFLLEGELVYARSQYGQSLKSPARFHRR